jgi:hypothetical protein
MICNQLLRSGGGRFSALRSKYAYQCKKHKYGRRRSLIRFCLLLKPVPCTDRNEWLISPTNPHHFSLLKNSLSTYCLPVYIPFGSTSSITQTSDSQLPSSLQTAAKETGSFNWITLAWFLYAEEKRYAPLFMVVLALVQMHVVVLYNSSSSCVLGNAVASAL